MKRVVLRFALPALVLLGLIAIWEVVLSLSDVPGFILPAPSRIATVFVAQFPLLLRHGAVTALEIALGLLFGSLGGIGLAIAVFYSSLLDRALYPLIIGAQMIPVFAIAPILIVWLGYGIWPKVAVAALISFFPLVINVSDGLRSPSKDAVDLFRSLGATRFQIFRKLRWPACYPSLFSGLKVATTLAVVGATIGEWVGSHQGLGYLMLESNARLRTSLLFAAILMLTLLGLCLFAVLRIIEQWALRWRSIGDNSEGAHG